LFEQLRAQHVRLIPVPRHADGPDLAALEAACRAHRPRAFFMQTLLHNPTGSSAEPAHCHRILSLAEQFGFAVVEDDVYGDLYAGRRCVWHRSTACATSSTWAATASSSGRRCAWASWRPTPRSFHGWWSARC